jgi:crossover junction endodeoxyribonuclease RusA
MKLPFPPKELNPNRKLHWAAKAKYAKAYREQCKLITLNEKLQVPTEGKLNLWITFYPPDKRARDDDNLLSAFKAGRDGIAEALGINDKRFVSHPIISEKTGGFVIIDIQPI